MTNSMMPGAMPQGSQNSFPNLQSTICTQPYQAVPNVRPRTIPGRMIYSPDEIMPQEVPMDGSVSLFPMHDWSCVYGKWWTSNGQIQTVKFVMEQPKKEIELNTADLTSITTRLDKIEKYLFRNKHKNPRPTQPNQNGPQEVPGSD
mgnify:CR=1 FL=1